MEELYQIITGLKMTEQKYNILVEYIKSEAKQICFDRDRVINFINILEDKKDGKEDETKAE